MEIEGLDAGIRLKPLSLVDHLGVLDLFRIGFAFDIGQVVHLFSEHFRDELYTGQVLDFVLADQLSVP